MKLLPLKVRYPVVPNVQISSFSSQRRFKMCRPYIFVGTKIMEERWIKELRECVAVKCCTQEKEDGIDYSRKHDSRKIHSLVTGEGESRNKSTSIRLPINNRRSGLQGHASCNPDDYSRDLPEEEELHMNSNRGTILGAIALIIGTSVGAGILALPAKISPAGFMPSVAVLGVCWIFLVIEALLLAEVNVHLLKQRSKDSSAPVYSAVVSLRTMAEQTMGYLGGILATVTYLSLAYSLMVAYIAKAGEVLSLLLHLPISVAASLFTLLFGCLIFFGGSHVADKVNQVLTAALIGLFMLILLGGTTIIHDYSVLERNDWMMAPQCLSVVFLALVYHDLTPVICSYLGGDLRRIRIAIILGSAVPLAMFLCWDAVALCIAPISGLGDPLDILMRLGGSGPALVVEVFSMLAIATSMIGTVLGLSEFFTEQLGNSQMGTIIKKTFLLPIERVPGSPWSPLRIVERNGQVRWFVSNISQVVSFTLIFAPPLLASMVVTDAFFAASDFAGAYGMTTLYGLFPPAMAWGAHESTVSAVGQSKRTSGFNIPGKKLFFGQSYFESALFQDNLLQSLKQQNGVQIPMPEPDLADCLCTVSIMSALRSAENRKLF